MELKKILKELKTIEADPCVSILLTTHRTHPQNAQDPINLKNLVANAEERLLKEYDKRHVWPILEKINTAVSEIDHQSNLAGLAVFANADMVRVLKLPITVTDRVILDHNFATRDLIRALQVSEHYYILTVSGHQSRLIEAYRDEVVLEYGAEHIFPIKNRLYNTHAAENSQAGTDENLMKEFCNRVDKAMQPLHASEPLPVMVAGDERNVHFMREVADHPGWYIGHITGSPDELKAHDLAKDAFKEVQRIIAARKAQAMDQIGKAQSEGKLMNDLSDIFRTVNEGRGDTLFVEEGHYQPAQLNGTEVILKDDPKEAGVMDDVIDEIAENTLKFGGNVVFLAPGSLQEHGRICLSARY